MRLSGKKVKRLGEWGPSTLTHHSATFGDPRSYGKGM